jgi:hypothetical protein
MPGLFRIPGEKRGGRGKPVRLTIHRKSYYMQRWLIHNPWIHPFSLFTFCATKIQKIARGFILRKQGSLSKYLLWRRKKQNKNAEKRAAILKGPNAGGKSPQLDKYLAFLDKAKGGVVDKPSWLEGGYSVWCIVRIQSWYRMTKPRRRHCYAIQIINQIGAMIIQSAWKEKLIRMKDAVVKRAAAKIARIPPHRASVRIQLAWRSFCNRRIFSYYRDLVMNKLQGAPQDLLRTIVPAESDFLDRAAGAIVRFRLGGGIFPPKVYFKVYTHRGVCDVNAFAPRVYAKEKMVDAFQKNLQSVYIPKDLKKYNTGIRVGGSYFGTKVNSNTSTDEWYKREERNDWRPIASQAFDDILTPPWLQEGAVKKKEPAPFHFSKLKRKTDLLKQKKRRRRMWLMKAYHLAGADLTELRAEEENSLSTASISSPVRAANDAREASRHHDLHYGHTASSELVATATPGQLATIYSPVSSPVVSRNQTPDRHRPRSNSQGRDILISGSNNNNDNAANPHHISTTYSGALGGVDEGSVDPRHLYQREIGAPDGPKGMMGGVGVGHVGGHESMVDGDHDSISESLAFLSMSGAEHESRSLELDGSLEHNKYAQYYTGEGNNLSHTKGDRITLPSTSLASGDSNAMPHHHHQLQQQQVGTKLPPIASSNSNSNNFNKNRTDAVKQAVESKMRAIEGDEALLNWSMALDYDDYSKGWATLATSLPSSSRPAALYNP